VSREKQDLLETASPRKQKQVVQAFAGVLAKHGGSINRIAEETGLPRRTVKVVKKDPDKYVKSLSPSELTSLQTSIASKLMTVADQLTDAIPHKIDAANLVQTSTSLGIVLDKARLILGLSTGRTENVNLTLHKIVQASNSGSVAGEVFKDVEAREVRGEGSPPRDAISSGEDLYTPTPPPTKKKGVSKKKDG